MVNLLPTAEGPADDDDCMMYLAASCSTVSSLRLQKCKPVGLDSIVQSRDTVDPSGAPINCWCSATDGGTVVIKKNEKKTKQNKEKLAIGNCWKPGGLLRSVRLGFSLLWERESVSLLFDRGIFEIPISETLAPFVYSNAPSSLYFGISILVSFYNVTVTRQNETSPFPIMPNKHRPTL